MRAARKVTTRDYLIRRLLQDPLYRVTQDGTVLTRKRTGRSLIPGPWRQAGWISPSRGGAKLYRRLQYRGLELYEHRIVFAALRGRLSPFKTVNHCNLNGLGNGPANLELITPGQNISHARQLYKRMGMSAAEAKRNWIKGLSNEKVQHGQRNN